MTNEITHETTMELLLNYRPKSVDELAEWLLMAGCNLKDPDGKRILNPLKPEMAYQIACMMKIANLRVPG